MVFLYPFPDQQEMIRRHSSREYADHPYFIAGEELADVSGNKLHRLLLEELKQRLPSDAHILDVGAGSGDFIGYASKYFTNIQGIEPSAYLSERARARTGKEIFNVAFEDFPKKNEYDAVILMDIIEHTADPKALLSKASEVLKPGGLLFVCTVDSNSLLYLLSPLVYVASSFVGKAKYILERIYCYQHNWYFNRKVLRGLLENSQFEVIVQNGYEFPLERLKESPVILWGLRLVYFLHQLLGMKTEQYILAKKL